MFKLSKLFSLPLTLVIMTFGNYAQAEGQAPIASSVPAVVPFSYIEDGEFSKQVHIPTYEWIPKEGELKGIILAVHGLTLHGKTFQVTGRAFASHGFLFIAPDMRGFGRCYKDTENKFSDAQNNRHAVNYKKSTDDFLVLTKLIKERYPKAPLILLAESLGCTTAVRMAAESPKTFHSLILSAPAMRLNPAMFITPSCIGQYTFGFATHLTTGISMNSFFKYLVSNDPQVVQETLADPLIRKKLHPRELIETLFEINRTAHYAKQIEPGIPLLFIQGSDDKCVSPLSVARLADAIESEDQTIRWFYSFGHLAFETSHLRAAVVTALMDWFRAHRPEYKIALEDLQHQISDLGGTVR